MKTLFFVGSSRKDLQSFPSEVKSDLGHALFEVQEGVTPVNSKLMKGFGAGVLEIIEDFDRNAYRVVCTVKLGSVVYVLHCFQKKSKHGIQTPLQDIGLIRQRLKMAEEHYRSGHGGGNEP